MANDLNKIMLIGRLGKDAELKDSKSGTQYMKFSLATNRMKGREEMTDWHNVTVWNEKLVENLHPYLVKGKQIFLEGLATSWRKDENSIIPQIEVNYGHNIQLLGEKMQKSSEPKAHTNAVGENEIPTSEEDIPF